METEPANPFDNIEIFGGKKLLPTQQRFLASRAPRKVYIGPLGSGKTEVIVWQALILSHFYAPNVGLIARHTYPELRATTRKRFMDLTPPSLIKTASIPESGVGGYIEWMAGGRTMFWHLDTVQPMEFGSLDLGYVGMDEITETRKTSFEMLEGRLGRWWSTLRLSKEAWPYSPLFGGGNSGGKDWVYQLFFKEKRDKEIRELYEGFKAERNENEANLPPNYYRDLARGKADWWIRRFIHGDFAALEGLVWPQWDDVTNVIEPFPIPPNWPRVMSFDHGRRNPTAAQWWTVDPWGNYICYRDYQSAGPTPREHAKAFLQLERGRPMQNRVADPSIFNKTQVKQTPSGDKWHSIAEEYEEHGIYFAPADNAVQASLERCGQLLWADPERKFPAWHPRAGKPGSPRAFFFTTCEESIESISSWKYRNFRVEDLGLNEEPVGVNDHLPDCFRYFATSFEEAPEQERPVVILTPKQQQLERKVAIGREIRQRAAEQARQYDPEGYDPDYV